MTQDHRRQILAAAVMAVIRTRADTPKWRRQEVSPDRSIEIDFVEVWTQVVPLEVGEDVSHDKASEIRPLASASTRGQIRALRIE